MSVPATTVFNIESLRRLDGPGMFLGGGFVAGLLVFALWLSAQPDQGRPALQARGNGVVGANGVEAPDRGVLGDITGELRAGAESPAEREDSFFYSAPDAGEAGVAGEEGESMLAPDERFDQSYVQDADAMAVGDEVGATPSPEGALTDSLLDPPAALADAPGAAASAAPADLPLRPWYVEVEVAPGVVQMLQLNAESPEHALAILRDFRGDPRVLRGPSPQPLP
jgi:hypothetical protein